MTSHPTVRILAYILEHQGNIRHGNPRQMNSQPNQNSNSLPIPEFKIPEV